MILAVAIYITIAVILADIFTQRALYPAIREAKEWGLNSVLARSPKLCVFTHFVAVLVLAPVYLVLAAVPGGLHSYSQELLNLAFSEDI